MPERSECQTAGSNGRKGRHSDLRLTLKGDHENPRVQFVVRDHWLVRCYGNQSLQPLIAMILPRVVAVEFFARFGVLSTSGDSEWVDAV